MFMVTLSKQNVRRIVGVALVGVVVCGVWFGRQYFKKHATVTPSDIVKITTTQDVQTYFTGYGITVDATTLSADRVQVPNTWDDAFVAFNEVVAQSGYDLTAVKGESIEKWVANIPAQSTGEAMQYAVLLLKESNIVGAYLLEKPSGEVTGLEDAVLAMAELRTNSGADSGSALLEGGTTPGGAQESTETSADVVEGENQATPEPDVEVSLEVDLEPDKDGFPVE